MAKSLNGVPVLFIPGNAGSYKQVRSLASEASKLFHHHSSNSETSNELLQVNSEEEQEHPRKVLLNELIFFSLDLREEQSILSGNILLDQAEFLNDCLRFLLQEVFRERNLSSVILVGHSMGGVVSKTAFRLPNYLPHSIRTIFVLNSPQRFVDDVIFFFLIESSFS